MVTTLDASPPPYNETLSQLDLTLTADPSGKDVLITIKPPAAPAAATPNDKKEEKEQKEELKAERAPVDFVLTIDVSGSMASEAPVPGDNERTGLSILDVVKHAANTIITTMKAEDRIAIVSFSGNAQVVLPLTHTDEQGKADALKKVELLHPLNSTNLWDGLKQSMNILTGAPPASDPGSPGKTVASLAAAGSAIAAGIANMTLGTPLPRPQYRNSKYRLSSIFLLTDGLPNVEPPRGHIPMLKLYLESQDKDKTKFTINTFGFGYSLDSKLLNEIAEIGNGHFGFIPDSGMVGTNFVHAVANTYATYAEGLYVDVEVDDGNVAKSMEVPGSFQVNEASWGVQVPLGQLQYGQTRDLVIRLPQGLSKSPLSVTARCRPWNSDTEVRTTRAISEANLPPSASPTDPTLLYHSFRLEFVSAVHTEIASTASNGRGSRVDVPTNAAPAFKDIASRTRAAFPGERRTEISATSDALDLAEDISGQVLLGVADSGVFNKWGLHYLLSLSRSHQRQQCGNFKDPSLQPYGRDSTLFKTTRDEIDMAFDNLPAPNPSRNNSSYCGSGSGRGYPTGPQRLSSTVAATPFFVTALGGAVTGSSQEDVTGRSGGVGCAAPPRAKVSMAMYNRRSAPCFSGSSCIELFTGENVPVGSLVLGLRVKTPVGGAKVVGIVRTSSPDGVFDLCKLGDGLLITPWHPVYSAEQGTWVFPADIATHKRTPCKAVYSLVLEKNDDTDAHAVFIGGVLCATMGHGVVDPADARAHPFLANHCSVMEALETHQNSPYGPVDAVGVIRDSETGLMCGFRWGEHHEIAVEVPVASPEIGHLTDGVARSIVVRA